MKHDAILMSKYALAAFYIAIVVTTIVLYSAGYAV